MVEGKHCAQPEHVHLSRRCPHTAQFSSCSHNSCITLGLQKPRDGSKCMADAGRPPAHAVASAESCEPCAGQCLPRASEPATDTGTLRVPHLDASSSQVRSGGLSQRRPIASDSKIQCA